MKNMAWWNLLTILLAITMSVGGTYGMLLTSDASNTVEIKNIKEYLKELSTISNKVNLHSQQITYFEGIINRDVNSVKNNIEQLQKSTNTVTVQINQIQESNERTIKILENLDKLIGGLNITVARSDERLKNLERGK